MLRKNEVQSVIRQTIMEHRHLGPHDALVQCADAVVAAVDALLEPGQVDTGYSIGEPHPSVARRPAVAYSAYAGYLRAVDTVLAREPA